MILRIHASLPLVVAAAFLAACPVVSPGATDAGSDETAADGSTTGSPMTGGTTGAETSTVMLSFATDIQPILDGACVPSCHTATPAAGSGLPWGDYSGGLGYMKWLGADGMGAASLESQALKLVEPGDREASYVLLEPVMAVEVVVPEDFMGDVMGNLSSRRGRIEGMEDRGNAKVVTAKVPLKEMFGYATDLRSATQGRATYTMQFSHYEPVPQVVSEEILAKAVGA